MDHAKDSFLTKRTEFIQHLEKDIGTQNQIYEENKASLNDLIVTLNHLKEVGKYPEHSALIPLCKNLYMPGKIVHTGEFYITRQAQPNSYSGLHSSEQTIALLQKNIEDQKEIVDKAEFAMKQVEERMKILLNDDQTISDEMAEMPDEVKSDKGVAYKVGDFYEIVEFE